MFIEKNGYKNQFYEEKLKNGEKKRPFNLVISLLTNVNYTNMKAPYI